jgi:hypothetical protein
MVSTIIRVEVGAVAYAYLATCLAIGCSIPPPAVTTHMAVKPRIGYIDAYKHAPGDCRWKAKKYDTALKFRRCLLRRQTYRGQRELVHRVIECSAGKQACQHPMFYMASTLVSSHQFMSLTSVQWTALRGAAYSTPITVRPQAQVKKSLTIRVPLDILAVTSH